MCASLIRSAYSPNIKERADCSTAICDMQGRTLSIATHAPAHLGSTLKLVPALLERFPIKTLAPGDVFFANDPYIVGVTHLNDCTAAAPPVGPGGNGIPRDDVWEMFLLNSRTPHFSNGDLLAQLAALERGRIRVEEIYARYGLEETSSAIERVLDATEKRMRSRIGEVLRAGTYSTQDWLDDDGLSNEPVKLSASISIDGDGVLFDLSGVPPNPGWGKNFPPTPPRAAFPF